LSEDPAERDHGGIIPAVGLAVLVGARILVSGSVHPWTGFFSNALLAALVLATLTARPGALRAGSSIAGLGAGLYFGAALLSIPFSISCWNSLRWFLLHLGDLFILLGALSAGSQGGRVIASSVVAAAALSGAWAVRQRLGGFEATLESGLAHEFARSIMSQRRPFGLTFSPDMLAAITAASIPLCLGLLADGIERTRVCKQGGAMLRIALPVAALAPIAAALVLTRSLGGWLAAGAALAIWAAAMRTRVGKRTRPVLGAAIIAVIVAGLAYIVATRGDGMLDLGDPGHPASMRVENWATGLKVYRDAPLSGAGGGMYGTASLHYRSMEANEAKHAHNVFVEVLAETGPAGASGLALIYISFFGLVLSLVRRGASGGRALEAGFAAGGSAIALHCLIDFDWQTIEVSGLFWLSWGVLLCARRGEGTSALEKSRALRAAAAVAAAVTMIALLHQSVAMRSLDRAVCSARSGEWAEAARHAEKAARLDPANDQALVLFARAAAASPGLSLPERKAEQLLRRAVRLNPGYPFHYRDLGMLLSGDDPQAALSLFNRAVSIYPNSMDLNLALGRHLRRQGNFDKAEEALLHAAGCSRYNADVFTELGLLELDRGGEDKAGRYLERAAHAPPLRSFRAINYARFLEKRGEAERARRFLLDWMERHGREESVARELERL